jgi:hypothetical protein
MTQRRRRLSRLRSALLLAIAGLYVLSIPWYRTPGSAPSLLFGLPDWVAVALGCYFGVALLNSVAWLLTDVPDAEPSEGDGGE